MSEKQNRLKTFQKENRKKETERSLCYKELAHTIMVAGESPGQQGDLLDRGMGEINDSFGSCAASEA